MSEVECNPQVGLCGHRSFISRALIAELARRGVQPAIFTKGLLGEEDLSGLDCLYLVLGRARPSPQEAAEELEQVWAYAANPRRAKRTVYLSSRRTYLHKAKAEELISSVGGVSVRPPAVFGPGQDPTSEMLIPSLVRTGGTVKLERPLRPSRFIHVDRLAEYLGQFVRPSFHEAFRQMPRGPSQLPGEFVLTPTQMRDLYLSLRDMEDLWRNRDPEDGPPLSGGTPGSDA